MDVSVSGTINRKTYLKKYRGDFSPLSAPLDPPMHLQKFDQSKKNRFSIKTPKPQIKQKNPRFSKKNLALATLVNGCD